MKMSYPRLVMLLAAIISGAALPLEASAQVFSYLSFDQGLYATAPRQGSAPEVASTTVPIERTITASTTYGATVTATYNVTDNGSVAVLDISTSGSIMPNDFGVGEGGENQGTMFNFTRPVRYTATLEQSGGGSLDCYVNGGGIYINTYFSNSTQTYSGIIVPGGLNIPLIESWGLSNSPTPTSQSGSDYLDFTFTAIGPLPEPSSALLIGVPASPSSPGGGVSSGRRSFWVRIMSSVPVSISDADYLDGDTNTWQAFWTNFNLE